MAPHFHDLSFSPFFSMDPRIAASKPGLQPLRGVIAAVVLITALAAPASAQHDCTPYPGTAAGEVVDSTWSVPLEQDDYQFTIPSDPGGGYVVMTVDTVAPSQPRMRIVPPSGQGVVMQVGTSFPGPSPYALEVAFEVDADATYDIEVIEDVSASLEDHPVAYQWSWTFFSKIDCYEENDGDPFDWPVPTFTSKTVPFDEVLEAFSIAGFLDFGIPANAPHGLDWHDFTLFAPTELWLATVSVPTDQSLQMKLHDSDGNVVLDPAVPPVGTAGVFGPIVLQPDTYYAFINPHVRGDTEVTLSEGDTIPDHFDRPYQFIISTVEIPPCGLGAIFCDGFESGNTTTWNGATP
ncbi:MAG: hypothetical protein K8J08_12185 [Thermoanaerobaculia bacterium]|nr:hypothetical protein [Thermoanaerobaculia bacterium]